MKPPPNNQITTPPAGRETLSVGDRRFAHGAFEAHQAFLQAMGHALDRLDAAVKGLECAGINPHAEASGEAENLVEQLETSISAAQDSMRSDSVEDAKKVLNSATASGVDGGSIYRAAQVCLHACTATDDTIKVVLAQTEQLACCFEERAEESGHSAPRRALRDLDRAIGCREALAALRKEHSNALQAWSTQMDALIRARDAERPPIGR